MANTKQCSGCNTLKPQDAFDTAQWAVTDDLNRSCTDCQAFAVAESNRTAALAAIAQQANTESNLRLFAHSNGKWTRSVVMGSVPLIPNQSIISFKIDDEWQPTRIVENDRLFAYINPNGPNHDNLIGANHGKRRNAENSFELQIQLHNVQCGRVHIAGPHHG